MKPPDLSFNDLSNSRNVEEARIKKAYSNRHSTKARYSLFDDGHLFMIQHLERNVSHLLRAQGFDPLTKKRILEIGCGTGSWLREFIRWGAEPENLTGIDLLPDRVVRARQLCPDSVTIETGSATQLALPNAAFDLVCQFTVFTSILDREMKEGIAAEMLRVVKNDGLIIWYDYHVNNPSNPDVRGVSKTEIRQLFPNCHITLKRITLAPPLGRRIAPTFWLLADLLEKIPFLCTHYIGAIRKREEINH